MRDNDLWQQATADAAKPKIEPAFAGVIGAVAAFLIIGSFVTFEDLAKDVGLDTMAPSVAAFVTCLLGFIVPFSAILIDRRQHKSSRREVSEHLARSDYRVAQREARWGSAGKNSGDGRRISSHDDPPALDPWEP